MLKELNDIYVLVKLKEFFYYQIEINLNDSQEKEIIKRLFIYLCMFGSLGTSTQNGNHIKDRAFTCSFNNNKKMMLKLLVSGNILFRLKLGY